MLFSFPTLNLFRSSWSEMHASGQSTMSHSLDLKSTNVLMQCIEPDNAFFLPRATIDREDFDSREINYESQNKLLLVA